MPVAHYNFFFLISFNFLVCFALSSFTCHFTFLFFNILNSYTQVILNLEINKNRLHNKINFKINISFCFLQTNFIASLIDFSFPFLNIFFNSVMLFVCFLSPKFCATDGYEGENHAIWCKHKENVMYACAYQKGRYFVCFTFTVVISYIALVVFHCFYWYSGFWGALLPPRIYSSFVYR